MKQSLFTATLDNGIILLGEDLPDLESVALALHAPAGAIHDGPGRCGLATLAGELCLRGAGARTSRELVAALEGAGVQWSQGVSTTHASFSGAMVARTLPEALPIFTDILRRPRLPEEEFEPARQMVLQTLAGTEDDPGHRTMLALREIHFPAPWGQPPEGRTADVERLTIADVRAFTAAHLRPPGLIIAIAGRIDWPDFVTRAEALFGDWEPGPEVVVPSGDRGPRVRHVHHDSQQTHVALAWPAPPYRDDASHEAGAVLGILGGGMSSRLFTEVRERRGLCYSVAAGYQTQRDFAAAVCHAGTTAARAQETLDVMLAEIGRLPGTITADELDRIKARVTSNLVMQEESSAARAGSLGRQWYHLGTVRPLADEIARYDRLTVAGIEAWLDTQAVFREAARGSGQLSIVSLGPEPLEVPHAIPA